MRIRKRFLSLSAAITPPPPSASDLPAGDHLLQPLQRVQQQELHPSGNLRVLYDNTNSPPSDPPPPPSSDYTAQIGLQPSGGEPTDSFSSLEKELESVKKKKEIFKIDDTRRKDNILSAEASSLATTASHLVSKGWLEGDRLIPIKKRRGSLGKRVIHDLDEENEMKVDKSDTPSATKKNRNGGKRGNVMMEGSRCSRVNGRGWRCCQQTLVGYSLCEHHLGKGRLRSMTSVRGRAQKVAPKKQDKEVETTPIDHHEFEDYDDDDDDEFEDLEEESMSSIEGTKNIGKRKKLGVVKARSLSSLLSQISS